MDTSMQMYAVLYSKFSPASQRFLALLDNVPKLKSSATLLCVDNRQVRQRIMNNAKLPVQEVPCVIRIFADSGYTELFEGEQAFSLIKNLILDEKEKAAVHAPPTSPVIFNPAPTPVEMTTPLPGPKLPQQMSVQQHMQSVEMSTPIASAPPNTAVSEASYVQIPKNPVQPIFDEIPSKPPAAGGVSSSSSYLQEIEKENMQRSAPERSLKSNNGGGSITLRAQQMQKEREQEMGGPGIRPTV